jgi:hypothetical protein
MKRVLVLGIYLSEREHLASGIAAELARSAAWQVEQRWIALGAGPVPESLAAVTTARAEAPTPKFTLLNRLLRDADLGGMEHVMVADDDITLPAGFTDRYLGLVERHSFALAQPARTHGSYVDHGFVERLDGIDARRTRYVETGPLFSVHRSAFPLVFPFDEMPPMGWGLDFTWPVMLERAGLRMGIVDATPADHSLRKPAAFYDHGASLAGMAAYLAAREHLTRSEAFTVVEGYAEGER